jgi:hypothetical protein
MRISTSPAVTPTIRALLPSPASAGEGPGVRERDRGPHPALRATLSR